MDPVCKRYTWVMTPALPVHRGTVPCPVASFSTVETQSMAPSEGGLIFHPRAANRLEWARSGLRRWPHHALLRTTIGLESQTRLRRPIRGRGNLPLHRRPLLPCRKKVHKGRLWSLTSTCRRSHCTTSCSHCRRPNCSHYILVPLRPHNHCGLGLLRSCVPYNQVRRLRTGQRT